MINLLKLLGFLPTYPVAIRLASGFIAKAVISSLWQSWHSSVLPHPKNY